MEEALLQQTMWDEEEQTRLYSGSAGPVTEETYPFVVWERTPTVNKETGSTTRRYGQMHLLGDLYTPDGVRMTRCGCPVVESEMLGIEKIYYGPPANQFSIDHACGECRECGARTGKSKLMGFREDQVLMKAEIPKWAALARQDNMGAVSGVTQSSKPKSMHGPVRVVHEEGHER